MGHMASTEPQCPYKGALYLSFYHDENSKLVIRCWIIIQINKSFTQKLEKIKLHTSGITHFFLKMVLQRR